MALALDDSTPDPPTNAARGEWRSRRRRGPGGPGCALRRVVAEVSANLELDDVFEDVLDSSQTLFGADVAGLWLLGARDATRCAWRPHRGPRARS